MAVQEQIISKPGFWARVRNVFTNELALEADIRRDERDRLTTELNQQLLENAHDIQKASRAEDSAREILLDRLQMQRESEAGYERLSNSEYLSHAAQAEQDLKIYQGQYPGWTHQQLLQHFDEGMAFHTAQPRIPELEPGYGNHRHLAYFQQQETSQEFTVAEQKIVPVNVGTTGLLDAIRKQEENIRQEWLSDLRMGRIERHALDSYFAGRIDQHNNLIDMAVTAHPDLRETLPPRIVFGQLREDLQQQVREEQNVNKETTNIAELEARYIEQVGEQHRFGIAV